LYFSTAGCLNLDTNEVTADGGLTQRMADQMGMKENLLEPCPLATAATIATPPATGGDPLTSLHMLNWMECVRSRKKPNADVVAGYNHSVANIMGHTAYETGKRVTFDDKKQEVVVS